MRLLKMWLFVQEGLIPCKCIKVISLNSNFSNLSFALRGGKMDFENIFTKTEAGSVSANIGFFCEGSKWVRVTLDSETTMTK